MNPKWIPRALGLIVVIAALIYFGREEALSGMFWTLVGAFMLVLGLAILWTLHWVRREANRRPHWNERREPPLTGSDRTGENPNGEE